MAKGANTGKSKRSHSYKPYDASNSSIVKRFTSKVSEILPGPSWISRWLSPTPLVNVGQERDGDDEEEEDRQQQPPVKRIRLQSSLNDYTHQNHVKHLSDLQEDSEELSPISRVDHRDGAVAGPSGLQIRRSNFISSTPATTQASSVINKVNQGQGDDGSDSSESTSGCSSLVPQAERTSASTALPKLSTETQNVLSSSGSLRRLSTSKDKFSKLNLSATISRPTFDSYVFHNPHNKSMNSSRSSQLDDSSPFYRGRTMYGGASANRESLSMSILSPSSKPRITNVKPVCRPAPERDTIGSSALRILRALEQISTPVTEAKKMPLNEIPRRRKPIQPFEELMIPQMPALLRLKRKHRSESQSSATNVNVSKDTSDSPKVDSREQPSTSVPTTAEQVLPPVPTTVKSLPSYSLRKEESNKKDNFKISIKGKDHEKELENERLPEVNLPNIKLDISSLPTFSLPQLNKDVTQKRVLSPVSHHNIQQQPSSESSISLKGISSSPSWRFKFSVPKVETSDGHVITRSKPFFKFSNPLEADSLWKENDLKNHSKIPKDRTLKGESTRIDLVMKSSNSVPELKRRAVHEDKPNILSGIKSPSNLQSSGSIMDFFNKTNSGKDKSTTNTGSTVSIVDSNTSKSKSVPNETTKSSIIVSKSSEVQSSDNKWSCNKCLIENNNSDNNCIKCGLTKIRDSKVNDLSKTKEEIVSSDSVKCKTCLSSSKISEKKCTFCSAVKSDATTAAAASVTSTSSLPPLSALFKKSAGSWECSVCMVSNKAEDDCCISCSSPKPGATKKPDTQASKSSFQFGIPTDFKFENKNLESNSSDKTSSHWGFKFGSESSSIGDKSSTTNLTLGGFKFGTDSNTLATTTGQDFQYGSLPPSKEPDTKNVFSFGPPSQEVNKKEEKELGASKTTASSKLFTFGSASESDNTNEKKDVAKSQGTTKEVPAAKKVSFSQQLVEEKTISSESASDPTTSFNFSAATKSDTQSSNTFSFGTKTPLFGSVSVPSSTTDNPVVSSSLFKFGNSSVTTTITAASTDSTNSTTAAPSVATSTSSTDNTVNVSSSTLLTNSDNTKANPTNRFIPIFSCPAPTSESDKKESAGIFGGFNMNNKNTQFTSSVVPSTTNFTFGSSANNDNKSNVEKEVRKEAITNNIFGEKKDNEPQTVFKFPLANEVNSNFFGNFTEEIKPPGLMKNPFFTGTNTSENVGGIFGSSKPEEWNAKPTFGSETFEAKPIATSSAAPFGSSSTTKILPNSTESKNEPLPVSSWPANQEKCNIVFNATSTQPNDVANTPFNMTSSFMCKSGEVTDNKSSGGFPFPAPSNTQLQQSTNVFGANTQQTPNMFGSSASLFNTGGAQPTNKTTTGPFTFGAQPQQTQGIFGYSTPSQVPSGGTTSMGETFTFGSQNAVQLTTPAAPAAAPVPPTFDPTIKPNFNFSGGATPTFSAQSSGLASSVKEHPERKIRKAVRRTLR